MVIIINILALALIELTSIDGIPKESKTSIVLCSPLVSHMQTYLSPAMASLQKGLLIFPFSILTILITMYDEIVFD